MKKQLVLLVIMARVGFADGAISGAGGIGCSAVPITNTAWTTSTSINATQVLASSVAGAQVLVTVDQGANLTAGAIQFQVDPGDGNFVNAASWQVVDPTSASFSQISMPYTMVSSTNKQFMILMGGSSRLQLKLTTAITTSSGNGSSTPFTTVSCNQLPLSNLMIGGTVIDGNSGNKSAQTQRVVLATDQPQLTNKLLVTPDANVKVNVVGNAGANVDGATGAAPPANVLFMGALASGATGGHLLGVTACDSDFAVNISTATTTLAITGVSGRQVRICSWDLVTAAANNVAWIEGTGATCGTGTAGMAGGTSAASGYNFAANGGLAKGTGLGEVMTTATTGDSVCIVTSAATQLSGHVKYTIY